MSFTKKVLRRLPPNLDSFTVDFLRDVFFIGAQIATKAFEMPEEQAEMDGAAVTVIEDMLTEIETHRAERKERIEVNKAMQMKTAGSA